MLYKVEIARVSYQQAEIEVEATDEDDAAEVALKTVRDDMFVQTEGHDEVSYVEPLQILVIPPK